MQFALRALVARVHRAAASQPSGETRSNAGGAPARAGSRPRRQPAPSGASRALLYRWEKRLEPRSRRPHRQRQPSWTSALMRKIKRLRADHPMWGKRKLAVLLRREGIDVSVSMVGRILTKLMARGVVTPVPMLRRKPGPRRLRIMGQRHA